MLTVKPCKCFQHL